MIHKRLHIVISALILFIVASNPTFVAAQIEVVLTPSKDNTLYEDGTGAVSNGSGEHFFAGATRNKGIRRAVLAFDIASNVPTGAVVDSVRLTLHVSKVQTGSSMIQIHRVLTDWGEGASNAAGVEGAGAPSETGDATWLHTFFSTATWTNAGGDFDATASVFKPVDVVGSYSWGSTAAMASDVQGWLDSPGQNFGWIIRGEEATPQSAKRFDSREITAAGFAPKLQVYYSIATDVETETVPAAAQLRGNYPNPFARSTKISFELDAPRFVTLDVLDILGREVTTLVSSRHSAGVHEVEFDALGLRPGIYIYRLSTAEGTVQSGKMILIR